MIPFKTKNDIVQIYDENGILTYEAVYQLYHQSMTPIRIVGTDFSILAHNPAMNALCQVLDPQIIGKRCFEVARSDTHCDTDECPVKLILHGEKEVIQHHECILWNGTNFPATVKSTPFFNELGEIIGVIQTVTDQSDLIAVSQALEKKNLELEQKLKEIEASYEITKILNEEVEVEQIAERIFETLPNYLPMVAGVFYAFDKEEKLLIPAYAQGVIQTPPPFSIEKGILGEAAKKKDVIFVENIPSKYLMISSGILKPANHHLACIPLISADELLGAIEIASVVSLKPHYVFLNNLSGLMGVAIQRALFLEQLKHLQEELRERNEKLQAQNEELQAQSEELLAQTEEIQAQAEELAAQRDALEQKTLEAEEANRMKSIFLSNMSHELRTPLNAIIGLVRLLKEDKSAPLTPKQQEYLDIVLRNGQNLLDLINDILDLTRIESGREEVKYDIIYLPDFVNNLCKNIRPLAETKPLKFEVIFENAPKTIFSDQKKIRQILTNLLGNAIKFTEKGEVKLIVEKKIGADRDFVCFIVSDTGIGIPEDALEIIFEPFRQVDGSHTRKYGGTGLGLSISKKLATLLGGEIEVESRLGKGTTFKVLIPVDRRSKYRMPDDEWAERLRKALLPPPHSTDEQPHGNKDNLRQGAQKLLLVDDDLIVGREVSTLLKQEGFKVLYSADPQIGLKLLREEKPDLVLLDLKMPVMDGFAFLREMRRDEKLKQIPVIVLTSLDIDKDTEKLFPPNVKGTLKKGNIRQEGLRECINEILSSCKGIKSDDSDYKDSVSSKRQLKDTCKKILVAEDNPDNLFLIKEILAPKGFEIIHATNGKEAVSLTIRHVPDLVLMDIQMPEMDGINATAEIRRQLNKHIPIIALTAKAMKGDRENILSSGLDDYISKPFAPNELIFVIEKWLNAPENRRQCGGNS